MAFVTDTDLAASGAGQGAHMVGFTQSTAGAVARTSMEKMRDIVAVKDFGAIGDGITNDTASVTTAASAAGGTLTVPEGAFRLTSTVNASINIVGTGSASEFKRTSGDAHLFNIPSPEISLRDLRLTGASSGTDATSNAGARVTSTTNASLRNVELTGMSGSAVISTGGSSYGRFFELYVHDRAGALPYASDVMLYTGSTQNITAFSRLEGSGFAGIYQQIDSSRNNNIFNYIGYQHGYGILDYQPDNNFPSLNLNIGNRIDGVEGDLAYGITPDGRRFGAGIYTAGTGANMSGFNFITNCNKHTLDEVLVPAGIGHNMIATPIPIIDVSNYIFENAWYGYSVAGAEAPVGCVASVVRNNGKDQIYYKNSDNAFISGCIVDSLDGSTAERCININTGISTYHRGAMITATRLRGGNVRTLEMKNTRFSTIVGTNISDVPASSVACWLDGDDGLTWSGVTVDGSESDNYAMRVINCSYSIFSNGIILVGSSDIALQIDGNCANSFFDKSILIYGKAEPMNFINNESPGCIVEAFGSGPPTHLKHQAGDRIHARAPAVGSSKGWICTAAGTPGTWVSVGNL